MTSIYYDKTEMLSYKALLNFLLGGRGTGKTFGMKEWSIKDALKTGHKFLWVRRYKEEIKAMRPKFFNDIQKKFEKVKFSVKGDNNRGDFLADDKVIGSYIALSTSVINKSISWEEYDKIIFDEFLIMGNTYRYLFNEVVLLLELISTVFRPARFVEKDALKPKGVYLIGNNTTVANPYFLYFHIPQFKGRFYHDKKHHLLVEMWRNKAFEEVVKTTSFGELIADTEYGEYNIENIGFADNDKFIKPKSKNAEFYCCIDYNSKTYGFWIDYKNGEMFCNYQYDPSTYAHYCLTKEDHSLNTYLIKNANNSQIKNIIFMFRSGNLFFDDVQIKSQAFEMLSYFIR